MNLSLKSALKAITPWGWGVGSVGASSLGLGLVNSWTELVTIGVTCLTVFLLALSWSFGRVGHQVRLGMCTRRVTVGDRAVGELVVANPTNRTLPGTAIELSVGSSIASFAVGRVAAGEEHLEPFAITTSRRGIVTVGPVRAVRGDPLGLVTCRQAWSDSTLLYIHPRTVRISASLLGFLRDVEGGATSDFSSSDVSFHALRDYVAGDDRRSIHWRTTAHVGKLMVRQFEEIRRAHLLIILDLDAAAWASADEFEEGVSVVASLTVASIRESRDVSIMTQEGPLNVSSSTRALDSLAGVELVPHGERLLDLAGRASLEVPQASVVAVVTGSRTSVAQVSGGLARLPLDTTSFGVRVNNDGVLEHRVVGGFTVLSVPTLNDFARGMRRIFG
ncbi:MAG: DUF58 domain-containing protein [Ancrocorticia sp.]